MVLVRSLDHTRNPNGICKILQNMWPCCSIVVQLDRSTQCSFPIFRLANRSHALVSAVSLVFDPICKTRMSKFVNRVSKFSHANSRFVTRLVSTFGAANATREPTLYWRLGSQAVRMLTPAAIGAPCATLKIGKIRIQHPRSEHARTPDSTRRIATAVSASSCRCSSKHWVLSTTLLGSNTYGIT